MEKTTEANRWINRAGAPKSFSREQTGTKEKARRRNRSSLTAIGGQGSRPSLRVPIILQQECIMKKKNLRILIVDDHDVVREGIRGFLSRRAGFEICGEAASGPDAIQKTSVLKPDIVVVDLKIPDIDGVEVTRRIRKICPQTEVVILTMYGSDEYVRGAMSAGALGFVLKTQTGRDLAAAIESASQQ